MAVHNTTADKLNKTLDLGGFPMPSIAITKTGIAHSNFGEIRILIYSIFSNIPETMANYGIIQEMSHAPLCG